MPIISIRDLVVEYDGRRVLNGVNLDIEHGETMVWLGGSGSGKSTLLRIVAGVERPATGTITIDDLDLWQSEVEARRHLAYVPEHPELTPYASIADVLQLGNSDSPAGRHQQRAREGPGAQISIIRRRARRP